MAAHTFDPSQVLISFHNQQITGYADGTFVTFSRNSPSFTMVVGADGEVTWVASADKSGTIKVTLLQTSAGNDILSSELKIDELTRQNIQPVFVQDLFGRTLCMGAQSRLEKPAEVQLGKDAVGHEWTIQVADMDIFVGGNT